MVWTVMKQGSRQIWGKDWIALLLLRKFLKAYPLITQQKIVSKLAAGVKSHVVFLRPCFARYLTTLPSSPTFDAGRDLLSRAGPWWPSCYNSMMGEWSVCILGKKGLPWTACPSHAWRRELIFPSQCGTKETMTLFQRDVCVCIHNPS